jgi:tape measure domain-containing protein
MTVGQVIAKLGVDPKEYEKGLRKAETQANKAGSKIGSIFKNAFSVTVGMGMFEALKKGFQDTVSTAIDFNSMLQTAQIGFATMLGSAEKAQRFLEDMADFAVRTPFEYPELLEAAKRMLAYGFAAEEVLPTLRAVGDASAALGSGSVGIDRITLALGQIQAKGKLSAEEMRQLTEAGVPAWHILAEAMGKTVPELQDMVSKGLVPGAKAVDMLTAGMTKRFGGMMASMEDTWQGVTSSIKDIWRMTVGTLTQNLFSGVLEGLKGIRDTASNFYNIFSTLRQQGIDTANALKISIAQVFGVDLATAISTLINAAQTAWKILINTAATIKKHWSKIKPVIVGVASAFLLFKVVPPIVNAVNLAVSALHGTLTAGPALFTFISKAIGIYRLQMHLASLAGITHVGVLESVKIAIYSVYTALGPIGWVLLAVAALLGVGTAMWNKYAKSVQNAWEGSLADNMKAQQEKLKDSISGATDATLEQADAITEVGKAADKNLQSFDEVHNIMEETADLAGLAGLDLGTIQAPVFDSLEIPEIDIDFSAMLEEQKPTLAGFWEWIKQGAANLWEGVKKIWNGFTSWISSWGIWTTLEDKWGDVKEGAGNLWEGVKEKWNGFKTWAGDLWSGIKTKWSDFIGWSGETFGPLWEGIKEKWGSFREWAGNLWEGVKEKWGGFTDWVQEKWSSFKAKAGEIWTGIKTNVQTKWEELKTNAPVIWENIKTSIQTRWENLKTSAGETWNNITTGIEEKWNSLETNAPIVWENIKTSIQERWDSLVSGASEKWGNIKSTISEKWEELKTNAPTVWENIKDEISQRWEELKVNAPTTWENIKKEISDRWEALKTNAPTAWNNISKTIKYSWKDLKTSVPAAWNDIKKTIADKWREIKEDALSWGENLIDGFVQGIKDKIDSVKSTLKNVGNTIKDFLGFSSPTKEGPGRDADKWAPNFVDMYRKGISQGIPGISSSLTEIAEEMAGLATMTVQPAVRATASAGYTADSGMMSDGIAQAVYRAIIDAFRITQASSTGTSSGESKELVLKIDNTVLARMQLPAIIREGQRQGLNLVVQGV